MYLHLGKNVVIRERDIIAVMDIDSTTVSKTTRNFLNELEKKGKVINIDVQDLPKSFILIKNYDKNDYYAYLSCLTVQTIYKRSQKNEMSKMEDLNG